MAYVSPSDPTAGQRAFASWGATVGDDLDDHESRMLALEGSVGATVQATPPTLANDGWCIVTDGASPESFSIAVKRSGTIKYFPIGTWV